MRKNFLITSRIICLVLLLATMAFSCFGWISFSDQLIDETQDFYEENVEASEELLEAIFEKDSDDVIDDLEDVLAVVKGGSLSLLHVSDVTDPFLRIMDVLEDTESDAFAIGSRDSDDSTTLVIEGNVFYAISPLASLAEMVGLGILAIIFATCLAAIICQLCNCRMVTLLPPLTMSTCLLVTHFVCQLGSEALDDTFDFSGGLSVHWCLYAAWGCAIISFVYWLVVQPMIVKYRKEKKAQKANPAPVAPAAPVYAATAATYQPVVEPVTELISETPEETWNCTCGAIYPAERQFCSACGGKKPAPVEAVNRCPSCHAAVDSGSPFCNNCGGAL